MKTEWCMYFDMDTNIASEDYMNIRISSGTNGARDHTVYFTSFEYKSNSKRGNTISWEAQ